jgi:ATP adenylyltransferase
MGERPLWAPWRIEYITAAKDGACIFCTAAADADDAAGLIVERGATCFTMLNRFPYSSGHLMVSPYRHVGDLQSLDEAELSELMTAARHAAQALTTVMSPDGFNIGLNVGTAAGAGFKDHLHLHVVPRWSGDTNFMPVLADVNVVPQALQETRSALAAASRSIREEGQPMG